MATLAQRGINPTVVNDQTGRLTFTPTITTAIHHLLPTHTPYGTSNVTNTGQPTTRYHIAQHVFALPGHDTNHITPTTTTDYFHNTTKPTTPPPHNHHHKNTR